MAIKSAELIAEWLNKNGLRVYCGPRKDAPPKYSKGGLVSTSSTSDEYTKFLNATAAPHLYTERIMRMSEEAMVTGDAHTYEKIRVGGGWEWECIQETQAESPNVQLNNPTFDYALTEREQKIMSKRNKQDAMFGEALKRWETKKNE